MSISHAHTTGVDLAPEVLSRILDYLNPLGRIGLDDEAMNDGPFKSRLYRLKHGLAAPSLACKHW